MPNAPTPCHIYTSGWASRCPGRLDHRVPKRPYTSQTCHPIAGRQTILRSNRPATCKPQKILRRAETPNFRRDMETPIFFLRRAEPPNFRRWVETPNFWHNMEAKF
jgi:hypothetical protein